MSPERHHWKLAVQAAAVMLRTPLVNGQSPASYPRPFPIYGAQFENALPVSRRSPASSARRPRRAFALCRHIRDGRKLVTMGFALWCHSNATRAPIVNPPNSAQLGGIPYHSPKLHPGTCNSVGIRPRTDTHTDRQTHRYTDRHTDARDHNTFCVVYDSRKM